MTFDADVIVAGAGPAGALAARALAAAGIDTLLVDRAAFPRNKPCGGGISTRALKRFPWLAGAIDGIDQHVVSRLHLEGPDQARIDITSPTPCVLLVRRVELDHALVRAALAQGARMRTGFEITQARADPDGVTLQARSGEVLRAPMVVAADGVHSVIGKRLGVNARWPRTHLAIDMMEETSTETLRAERPDELWAAYAYEGLEGYAYIFPKARHVNVGIGCLLSHYDAEVDAKPEALQTAFVETLIRRGVLHGRRDPDAFTPYLIPVGGPLASTTRPRVLFTGDAGGFVNGVTAEGIYYAMVSGALAGESIAAAHRAGRADAATRYEAGWKREIGAELVDAVALQRLLFAGRQQVTDFIRHASNTSPLTTAILEYFRGERSYRSLRRRIMLRHPLAAVRLARHRMAPRQEAS
ncbi:MAG: NAD(P)/FAD-dependent oxidoreductase [Acidobacteria bacterium]|nr:NAD(P)/FAD-dependent oxidoreductase [Acidobacteriota bacterium]